MMAGEDYVHVKLSAAGERLAGEGGTIQLATGRSYFKFKVGEPQRVTRAYEWEVVLRNERYEGEPIFIVAEEGPQPAQVEEKK
jgi:hypothetical protein